MPANFDALLAVLPGPQSALVANAGSGPLLEPEELRRQVQAYLASLPEAARVHEFMDVGKAREVGERCLRLIDTLAPATPESTHRAIQAAVVYFVLDDDADSDTESVLGFDDDEAVVEAVERILGLS